MRASRATRGRRLSTRYQASLWKPALMPAPRPTGTAADPPRGCGPAWERPAHGPALASRPPFPPGQAQPVGEAVGPDPQQATFASVDLAHALHARAQPRRGGVEHGLHLEGIAAIG